MPGRRAALLFILAGGLAAVPPVVVRAAPAAPGPAWAWDLTAGFDSFTHAYALANTDTSETVSEFLVQADAPLGGPQEVEVGEAAGRRVGHAQRLDPVGRLNPFHGLAFELGVA